MEGATAHFFQSYVSNHLDDTPDLGAFVERGGQLVGDHYAQSVQ